MPLKIGDSLTKTKTVTRSFLASSVGSGSLDVLATPMVAALMEETAAALAQQGLEPGCTTVGTQISIEHTSPTPLHAEFSATATLTEQEGRMFKFLITAQDRWGKIAEGIHTRVSVNSERFQRKADEKLHG